MKKIGILFGMENTFPWAFIDRVNQKTGKKNIIAEPVLIDKVEQGVGTDYSVIIDRIMPLDWQYMFSRVGFPAYMKPHSGGGWKSVYRVENPDDLWAKHSETGQLVMMLQEEITFTDYYRCYCLGGKYVHIMPYEPRNPHHLRYATQPKTQGEAHKKLMATITDYVLKLNHALGYDFNTVEFAVRDGIPYAIDFCNPAPDADVNSVGHENFEWVVEHAALMAIEKAENLSPEGNNLTWGTFVKNGANPVKPKTKATKKA
ncbi:MAG: hypothetical protein IPO04_00270 [Cytophagaceae bacterium]|nr:hypothetical protein [Cytophagaceae bacterium]